MKKYPITLCLILLLSFVSAQEPGAINFATASHPLRIIAIQNTNEETEFVLELTNQVEGGYFCIDKKINIKNENFSYSSMALRSVGIPICPDIHRFRQIGEKLCFSIFFKRLPKGLKYINLEEICDANCLSVQGVVLNELLNRQINEAFFAFENQQAFRAVQICEQLIRSQGDYPFAIKYFYLIHFLAKSEKYESAKNWFQQLRESQFIDTQQIIQRIERMPYYRFLI